MPTRTGIFWNVQKDMTFFDVLLRDKQTVIFAMDNIYDSVFTGIYNVTITALYYDDEDIEPLTPADLILPISTKSSAKNLPSMFSIPDDHAAVSMSFPRNVERAVVSILASGNGAEEFWYTNVPTEYVNTFNNGAIYGYSPWREAQLLIDGELAGVNWPFLTVFTGGISPGLWVPVVGIDTYDLPSFEIDISPWIGVMCDGKDHTFEINVVGYDSKTTLGTVGSNWWVTGAVFLWLDDAGNQTLGSAPVSLSPPLVFDFKSHITTSSGVNTSLGVELVAYRSLSHTAMITTSAGNRTLTWSQSLSYQNIQQITNRGYNESLSQITSGTSSFSSTTRGSKSAPHQKPFTHTGQSQSLIISSYEYAIDLYQANLVSADPQRTNNTLVAVLDRSFITTSVPILSYLTSPSSFPSYEALATRQNGSCIYYWNNTYYEFAGAIDPAVGTIGETEQWYSYSGPRPLGTGMTLRYGRHVVARDGYEPVLVEDEEYTHTIEVPRTHQIFG
ncbi:MAG: hypothetical protein M1818_001855 [Claussenomyces sp. TS43310]|nr:MAG: hypothetical protein M1818_001855 [Claussenomyces sp. TS43310]